MHFGQMGHVIAFVQVSKLYRNSYNIAWTHDEGWMIMGAMFIITLLFYWKTVAVLMHDRRKC